MRILIFLLLLWVIPDATDAQNTASPENYPNRLALHLNTANYNAEDLDLVRSAGFSIVVLDSLNSAEIDTLAEDFLIFYDIGIQYLLPSTITQQRESLIQGFKETVSGLSGEQLNRISAIGLFRLPMESNTFHQFSEQVADTLHILMDKPLYYHSYSAEAATPSAAFDFVIAELFPEQNILETAASPVTYFHPAEHYRSSILRLDQLLDRSLQFEQSTLILPFDWMLETLREQPGMAVMLHEYIKGDPVSLPLPASESSNYSANAHLIIFWILIVCLVILIKYHPVIPQFALRYYLNHYFFMQDIMEGRVRNPRGGLYFLAIHSLFTGLFIYIFLNIFYTEPGFNVLAHFADWAIWTRDPVLSFVIATVLVSVLIHIISVVWLYLFIKDIQHLYKAVNLYSWGLFAHILLTALLVGLSYFDPPLTIVYFIGGAYYAIWASGFLIASFHSTKKLERKRYIVLLSTFVIYLIIAIALIALPFQSDKLIEIFQLAYQVSG